MTSRKEDRAWTYLGSRRAVVALAAGIALLPLTATRAAAQEQAPVYTVLYNFTGGADGAYPAAGLIADDAGNLYGTTQGGGNTGCTYFGCGVVFKLDPSGNETVLYAFTGGADGASPYASLIRDSAGNLYGTTLYGPSTTICNCGVVFKLDSAGKETVLHAFSGADGATPRAGLIRDPGGNLYGTTEYGGADGAGVVFKLDPTGNEMVLHSFTNGADGGYPLGG